MMRKIYGQNKTHSRPSTIASYKGFPRRPNYNTSFLPHEVPFVFAPHNRMSARAYSTMLDCFVDYKLLLRKVGDEDYAASEEKFVLGWEPILALYARKRIDTIAEGLQAAREYAVLFETLYDQTSDDE